MPALHLDTNILIGAGDPQSTLRIKLQQLLTQGDAIWVSAMTWSEFRCGPASPDLIEGWRLLLGDHIVPIDQPIAELGATLFNQTGRRSRSLPDCLIAATALTAGAPLATLNHADFEPFFQFGLILRS